MALDLSAASLIRAGSGVVYVAVGLLTLAVARASPAGRALGVFAILWGLGFAIVNPLATDPALLPWGITIQGALFFCAAGALLTFHAHAPWRASLARRHEVAAFTIAFALGVAHEIATSSPAYLDAAQTGGYDTPFAAQAALFGRNTLATTMGGVALAAAFATRRGEAARHATARGLLVVGLLGYWAYQYPALLFLPTEIALRGWALLVLLTAVTIVWIGRSHWAALSLPALGLLGMIEASLGGDLFQGGVGIARIVCALLLAWAILRGDLLDVGQGARGPRRGAMATGGLATLFIVAQVAQQFLSAQYGLLMGGIVAGAFLFAAQPLQRAMERIADARASPPPSSASAPWPAPATAPAPAAARREQAYLNAARLAMRDRRLTRAEEAHLHALADELGLGAKRAHELLVQAEQEAGAD